MESKRERVNERERESVCVTESLYESERWCVSVSVSV